MFYFFKRNLMIFMVMLNAAISKWPNTFSFFNQAESLFIQFCFYKLSLYKKLFTSVPQNSYSEKLRKSHRKTTVMKFFFCRVPDYHSTKIGLYQRSFLVNFVKSSRTAFRTWVNTSGEHYNSVLKAVFLQ